MVLDGLLVPELNGLVVVKQAFGLTPPPVEQRVDAREGPRNSHDSEEVQVVNNLHQFFCKLW